MEVNGHSESAIPEKNLFRIGEVSRLTATKQFVLRFWETEFPMLQPVKSPKGHRLYRREDIDTVLVIKRLLYDEGFTIAGARRHLTDPASGSNGSTIESSAAHSNGNATPENHRTPPAVGLDRETLLSLRDSLRSLLTVLESE